MTNGSRPPGSVARSITAEGCGRPSCSPYEAGGTGKEEETDAHPTQEQAPDPARPSLWGSFTCSGTSRGQALDTWTFGAPSPALAPPGDKPLKHGPLGDILGPSYGDNNRTFSGSAWRTESCSPAFCRRPSQGQGTFFLMFQDRFSSKHSGSTCYL